jgi:hypothetical protein
LQDQRPDPQGRRRFGGDCQRRSDGQLLAEMIGHEQDAEAERLGLSRSLFPFRARGRLGVLDAEKERTKSQASSHRLPYSPFKPAGAAGLPQSIYLPV